MSEVVIAVASVVGVFHIFLLTLLLKRLSEIDAKLDRHIEENVKALGDIRVLKDRSERP